MWHEPALCSVWGAALHISCLSAANGPRVMMKRFTEQKGREGDTQRQGEEREARAGGGGREVGKNEGTNTN